MERTAAERRPARLMTAAGIAAVLLCAVLPGPASAMKHKMRPDRVVTHEYTAPGSVGVAPADVCGQVLEQQNTCFGFDARSTERYLSIEVADDSGTPVAGYVKVVVSETETEDYPFCGATTQPIPLNGHTEIGIVLNDQSADAPCTGLATTGTVTATFSSMDHTMMKGHHHH